MARRTKRMSARSEPAADGGEFRAEMSKLIAERWGEVWRAAPVAIAGEDIEGVHDVRVATRRLRAAMDVAIPAFPTAWYRKLHAEAKQMTGKLGEVRDRDVLVESLNAELKEAPEVEHPGIHRLINRVEAERVVAREEMERYLRAVITGGIPEETVRRFGSAAGPPPDLDENGASKAKPASEESRS